MSDILMETPNDGSSVLIVPHDARVEWRFRATNTSGVREHGLVKLHVAKKTSTRISRHTGVCGCSPLMQTNQDHKPDVAVCDAIRDLLQQRHERMYDQNFGV